MKAQLVIIFTILLLLTSVAVGQTDVDRDAIKRAALDYAEGWYEGDPEKMERSLHPMIAKRISRTDESGKSTLDEMSSLGLVRLARGAYGKNTPKDEQLKEVTILDVYGGAATVKLEMRDWIDYMHIAKYNGSWLIVNVLWESKPAKKQ